MQGSLLRLSVEKYSVNGKPILEGLDISIRPGSRLAVLGKIGSGKSTALGLLAGLWPSSLTGQLSGTREMRDDTLRLSYLFQDPDLNLCATRVADELKYSIETVETNRSSARARLERTLKDFDLYEHAEAHLDELSVGWRQWVGIVAGIAREPNLLLWDEPTAHLDASKRRKLANLLSNWCSRKAKRAMVIATHDLEFIDSLGAERLELRSEGEVELGGRGVAARLSERTLPQDRRELLKLDSVVFGYKNKPLLFQDLTLSIFEGECLVVVGPNGSGKSTLGRIMAGVLKPQKGEVSLHGCRKYGLSVGYVAQLPGTQLFAKTVGEELHLTAKVLGIEARLDESSSGVLPDVRDSDDPWLLSYGQQRLVQVAAFDALPAVLVVDEPPNEQGRRTRIIEVLGSFRSSGRALVIFTHDLAEWASYADRVICLETISRTQDTQYEPTVHEKSAGRSCQNNQQPSMFARLALLLVLTLGITAPAVALSWFVVSGTIMIAVRDLQQLRSKLLLIPPGVIGLIALVAGALLNELKAEVFMTAVVAGARMFVVCATGLIFVSYFRERDLAHLFYRLRMRGIGLAMAAAYRSVPLTVYYAREVVMNGRARGLLSGWGLIGLVRDSARLAGTILLVVLNSASNLATVFELRGIRSPGSVRFGELDRLGTAIIWVWAVASALLLAVGS